MPKKWYLQSLLVLLVGLPTIIVLATTMVLASPTSFPIDQAESLWYDEAQTVYLGNLARKDHSLPPLRWNQQLTHAARWFSWDSLENQETGYCSKLDSNGDQAAVRIAAWGYLGDYMGDNLLCDIQTPAEAIAKWLDGGSQQAHLLSGTAREVGVGYYQQGEDGYIAQNLGSDRAYPPVVINHEAPATSSAKVDLYIYDRDTFASFTPWDPAVEMQVSNDPYFTNAVWEPFAHTKSWNLAAGADGWRTVYVRTRDVFSRTSTVADSIYLGSALPKETLGSTRLSGTRDAVTLYGLDGGGLAQAQFSLGWLVDDTHPNFVRLWGTGAEVDDPKAWGGSAFKLGDPGVYTESSARVHTTTFFKDVPLVAYVRLKVSNNQSPDTAARFSVIAENNNLSSPVEVTLSIPGTAFSAPNTYQEFALPFVFPSGKDFLIFQFWGDGSPDVYVDAVSIFTPGEAYGDPHTWAVPGGSYRGQGVWVRYTDGAGNFTPFEAVQATSPPALTANPSTLSFFTWLGGPAPAPAVVTIFSDLPTGWIISDAAGWLNAQANGNQIDVWVSPAGLDRGLYKADITVSPTTSGITAAVIPVELLVGDALFLPLISR